MDQCEILETVLKLFLKALNGQIEEFVKNLKLNKPPISKINSLKIKWMGSLEESEFDDFIILESSAEFSGSSVIPPDVAVCDKCLGRDI